MATSEEIREQALKDAKEAPSNYSVDYNDERFQKIESDYQADSAELSGTYNDIINSTQGYYDDLKDTMQQQADKMAQIQQDNTDFAIEKIEQQKEQAQKDYIKEQSGAYTDWRKQSNQYGVNAEKMASAGLANTGYSESSQVSMYNTYQNRVAMARDSLERAKLNYDNGIKDAILQNNAAIAEIYTNLYIKQAELSLEGFQYKNQLVLELANKKTELKNMKWQKELATLEQMNTENALKWNIQSYYDDKAWQTDQKQKDRDAQKALNDANNKHDAEQAVLDRQHAKDMLKEEWTYTEKELAKELANDKALASYTNSLGSSLASRQIAAKGTGSSYSSGSSSKTSSSASSSSSKINGESNAVNTAYYSGSLNSDAKKYGTFSNGYQPKGISGHGKVTKTGDTVTFKTQTLYGQKQTVTQNVWKTPDGKKWYWEGRQNKYIQVK